MSTVTLNLDLESGRINIEIESLDREFAYFLQSDIGGKEETLYRDRGYSFMSKIVSLLRIFGNRPCIFLQEVNENEIDTLETHDSRRLIFYIEEKRVILYDTHTEENLFEYPDHLDDRYEKDEESSH